MQTKTGGSVLAAFAVLIAMLFCFTSAGLADTLAFSTGNPDGRMAVASRPDSPGKAEIEAADDFVLTAPTAITHATFTGLLPADAAVVSVRLEVYRVFPLDSNTTRVPRVPTRVNSPSDVAVDSRDSVSGQLTYEQSLVATAFTAANSVSSGINPSPNQTTGGEGPVTGREVKFFVTLLSPFELPAGHYFFIPQVQVSGPASTNFYWLSSPRPIVAPGTPFPAGAADLQAWIRNSALAPDWLRIGTDIVGGNPAPTFNAAFSLDNTALPFSFGSQSLPSGIGVRLAVKVPAAGRVQVFDPQVGKPGKNGHKSSWFNTVTVNATHAGVVHLKLVPNATGLKQLARTRTIHLLAKVTFTPPGGQPATHTLSITWHRK